MGQFRVQIMRQSGSVFGANQQAVTKLSNRPSDRSVRKDRYSDNGSGSSARRIGKLTQPDAWTAGRFGRMSATAGAEPEMDRSRGLRIPETTTPTFMSGRCVTYVLGGRGGIEPPTQVFSRARKPAAGNGRQARTRVRCWPARLRQMATPPNPRAINAAELGSGTLLVCCAVNRSNT